MSTGTPTLTAPASPVDEARGYAAQADEGLTIDQIAARAGCRPRRVRERLALLELTDDTLRRVDAGQLPVSAALQALRIAGGGTLPAYRPRRTPPPVPAAAAAVPVARQHGKKRVTSRKRPRRAHIPPSPPAIPAPEPTPVPAPIPAPAGWFAPEHPLAAQAHDTCVRAGHQPAAHACPPCRATTARTVAKHAVPLAGAAARAVISAALWQHATSGRTEVSTSDLESIQAQLGRGPKWLTGIVLILLDTGELLPHPEPGRYGLPRHEHQLVDADPVVAHTQPLPLPNGAPA